MKILFIDPVGDRESTGLNLGIAYCATSLFNRGHTVGILDLVNIRRGDPYTRIKEAVENFAPDIIGLSITNMSFNNAKSYIADIKRYFNGNIIIGGPEISALGGKALELMQGADIAVIGEGENTLVELLGALEKKADLASIKGLAWRCNQKIVVNPYRGFINNLDEVAYPNYELFGVDKMDVYPISTTRGCPYQCIFCFGHLGKKWRKRSVENVIEEIRIAKNKYGANLFHICDPSFNIDIKRVERFCQCLIEEKLDMPWVIQGFRADRVTEDMMRWLKKANCGRIWVGIETLEEDIFKNVNKGETLEQIKKSIELMKKYKIEIFGYMIVGLPGDTFKKTLRSFENARKLNLDFLAYASCVPFTGTALEKWTKEKATIVNDSYNLSSIGTAYENIAFETEGFNKKERAKARRILNIKTGGYSEYDADPFLLKFKKWLLILRFDFSHLFSRIKQSIDYRMKYKTSVDRINLKRGIYYYRLPDGTWGLRPDEVKRIVSPRRFFLNLKRLTIMDADLSSKK